MFCPVCRSEYPADYNVCPKDATHLLRTSRVGKYAIEGLLGVGGMGAVYRASNPDTKARVAIKLMNPNVASADEMRVRFQREAAAVAALRTSHVVKVYDFGSEEDGTLYLVMELLDGHALRDEITAGPTHMDLARVQMVMDGALKGLAAAHKAGIVHRDLKPENVFVAETDDGEVPKLLDFGIARVRTKDQDLTRTGSMMGTASYMAPEQVSADAGEMGSWSDVYAMGAILYEMLAGSPAFGGETLTEILAKVIQSDVVPLATLRPGLPEAVYALIERCMSPDRAERPQDAEAMRSELAAASLVPIGTAIPPPYETRVHTAQPSNAPAVRTATRATVPTTLAPAPRSHRAKVVVLIAAGVALGVGGVFIAYDKKPATSPPPPVVATVTPDAALAPPTVDAASTEVDAAPIDAAVAVVKPPIAKPKPVPVPVVKEEPAPASCDGKKLLKMAREANRAGDHGKAFSISQEGVKCANAKGKPQFAAVLVFSACKLGKAAIAKQHFKDVPPARAPDLVASCNEKSIHLK